MSRSSAQSSVSPPGETWVYLRRTRTSWRLPAALAPSAQRFAQRSGVHTLSRRSLRAPSRPVCPARCAGYAGSTMRRGGARSAVIRQVMMFIRALPTRFTSATKGQRPSGRSRFQHQSRRRSSSAAVRSAPTADVWRPAPGSRRSPTARPRRIHERIGWAQVARLASPKVARAFDCRWRSPRAGAVPGQRDR